MTWHFGYDLATRILERTRMPTVILQYDRLGLGIRAEHIDVLMSLKPAANADGGGATARPRQWRRKRLGKACCTPLRSRKST